MKRNVFLFSLVLDHKGCDVAWALFWALKKALKRVKPLKKGLSRVNLLFWALRKVLKRADLLKIVLNWEVLLKRGLNWVGYSKKGSREERNNSKEGSGLNWVSSSKKCQREQSRKNKKLILLESYIFWYIVPDPRPNIKYCLRKTKIPSNTIKPVSCRWWFPQFR